MVKYARIEHNKAIDVITDNPFNLFHEDLAKTFIEVPNHVIENSKYDNITNEWINPMNEILKQKQTWLKVPYFRFKMLFTSLERIAIKKARETDPVIEDFYDINENPLLPAIDFSLPSTQEFFDYLEQQGFITSIRKQEIYNGRLK